MKNLISSATYFFQRVGYQIKKMQRNKSNEKTEDEDDRWIEMMWLIFFSGPFNEKQKNKKYETNN